MTTMTFGPRMGAIESTAAKRFSTMKPGTAAFRLLIGLDPFDGEGSDDMASVVRQWCERHGAEGYLTWERDTPESLHYVMWPSATDDGARAMIGATKRFNGTPEARVVSDNHDCENLVITVRPKGRAFDAYLHNFATPVRLGLFNSIREMFGFLG